MQDRLINVGIIGLGQMGLLHAAISNSLPNTRTVAVCDSDSRLIKIASKITKSIKFYDDYDEMFDNEIVDAVFVCTPPHTHFTVLNDLKNKTHKNAFFVEKPLASNAQVANRIVDMFPSSAFITMVGFQKRYAGTFSRVKELLSDGIVGEVFLFRAHHFVSENYGLYEGWKFKKETGGVLLEFAPHIIDLILWYFGEPDTVHAQEKRMFSAEVEDYVHALFNYKSNILGIIDVGWSMRNYRPGEISIEIHGSNGTIVANEDKLLLSLDEETHGMKAGRYFFPKSTLTPQVPYLLAYPENVIQDQFFTECVRDRTNPENDFSSGLRVNRVIERMRHASQ
jgi:predicted dehydrogenase